MTTQTVRRISVVALAVFLMSPLAVFAAGPADRISSLSTHATTALAGSAHPMARPEFDKGAVADSTQLSGLALNFTRSAAQQASLESLIAAQNDPSSPQFHQWLTPEQFAASYGMSSADIATATAWLQSQGFSVVKVADSGNAILFTGTAGQVHSAFGTEIHHYTVSGVSHYANASAVTLPAGLALAVGSVSGLDDFKPAPKNIRAQSAAGGTGNPTALFTSGISGNHYLTPGDWATIYDVKPLYNSAYTGTGETIGIVGQTDIVLSDVTAFRAAAGLPVNNPTVLLIPGSGDPGISYSDLPEADLDLEWSGGIAYNANIVFLNSTNAFNSAIYAIQNRVTVNSVSTLIPILSSSYGLCEAQLSSGTISTLEAAFQQAIAQGQTLIAASGDNGAADCDQGASSTLGLAVDYPASSAYVTGIGGTEFNEGTSLGGTTYWTSNGSTDVISSAVSYIPEMAWNDTSTAALASYYATLLGGGGGKSILFAKPTWQTGVSGIPVDGQRDVPDISLSASPVHDAYLVCTQVQLVSTLSYTGSCGNGFRIADGTQSDNNVLTAYGGTSLGAPSFAGVMALIEQKLGSQQGLINKALYTMASNSTTYASAFHDVTTGSNAEPCSSGTGCIGGSVGYSAGTGYDQATGLGSIDANNFATAFANYVVANGSKVGTSVTLTYLPTTLAIGQQETFTAHVTANTGSNVPTGTVTFSVDGVAGSPVTLVSGTATYNYSFPSGGTHTVVASYSGDTNDYASLSPTLTLTGFADAVGAATTTTTLVPNVSTASLYSSTSPSYTATVVSTTAGTLSGTTVTFTVGTGTSAVSTKISSASCSTTQCVYTLASTATTAAFGYSSGTVPVTAHYDGNTNYKQSTSTSTVNITVSANAFTINAPTVTASSSSLAAPATSTVTVTSVGGFTDPVGLIVSSTTISFCYGFSVNPVQPTASTPATTTLSIISLNACGLAAPGTPGANMKRNIAGNAALGTSKTKLAGGAGAVLAVLCLAGCMVRRRKVLPRLAMVAVLMMGALLLSATGCGGTSTIGAGLTTGTYTLTMTGIDTVNTQEPQVSTNFTLVVH